MNNKIRRLGVFIGKDGYCVGMEVRHSFIEEQNARKEKEYHHTRPLLAENGFYVFDGILIWQPIFSNLASPIFIPTDIKSPLVFLGEGNHLITSTKENDPIDGQIYTRKVEICPSAQSEHICLMDWQIFENDFLKL